MILIFGALLSVVIGTEFPHSQVLPGQADRCRAVAIPPFATAGERAWRVMGVPGIADSILHYTWIEGTVNNFQSDRPYPPFFTVYAGGETWAQPVTGLERLLTTSLFYGTGPTSPRPALVGEHAAFLIRDTVVIPSPLPMTSSCNTGR